MHPVLSLEIKEHEVLAKLTKVGFLSIPAWR